METAARAPNQAAEFALLDALQTKVMPPTVAMTSLSFDPHPCADRQASRLTDEWFCHHAGTPKRCRGRTAMDRMSLVRAVEDLCEAVAERPPQT
ncbi:MAG: hypothetical protein M3R02_31830 [Chloroflexota bacterium]|nr:hypothetical protein [Chloroflexota bacterium]